MSGDEVCLFAPTIDDIHNHVVTMEVRQLNNKVNTDHIPSLVQGLGGMELSR
jgi:hypothetical protein